jgi:hypothetical protein
LEKTLEQNRRRIDIVSEPAFVAALDSRPLDELRSRRALCDELDTELSYYRRLLHGRMDLLSFELRRRRGEETRSLIEALPEILADSDSIAAVDARIDELSLKELSTELPEIPQTGNRRIDRVLGDDFLAHLPTIEDAELEEIQAALTGMEAEVSAERRIVYTAYEQIVAEITRRYRDGLVNADELLES